MNISIPTFNEAYNYFLLQQEDELLRAQARFEEALLASTYAEEDAQRRREEERLEEAYAPLYEAEEQAMAQDEVRKAKHRKHRESRQDEYHHHRKPYWKYRDLNNRFSLNRKAEKRRLKVDDLLSQYEAEEQTAQDWAEKEEEKEYQYMFNDTEDSEYSPAYVWNVVSVSTEGFGFPRSFSYSCPEDFGDKFYEIEEEEIEDDYDDYDDCYDDHDYNDYDDDTRDDLSGDDYAYNHGFKVGYHEGHKDGYESGYFAGGEIGYNRGRTAGLHEGREEGKKYVLNLLKEVGINVNLEALIEQSLKC